MMQTDLPYISGAKTKDALVVILLTEESTPKSAVYLSFERGEVGVRKMSTADFEKKFVLLTNGGDSSAGRYALQMLQLLRSKFSTAALCHLERIVNVGTGEMSTEKITAEVRKLLGKLPADNIVRKMYAVDFPHRAAAIAAYTAVRSEVFTTTKEQSTMATKTVGKNGTTTAAAAAADPKAAAAAKAEKAAAAKAEKAAAAEAAKTEKAAAREKAKAEKAAAKAANPRKPRAKVELTGSYKLIGKALEVKTPEELKLHEGSARFKLMALMFANAKLKGGVPVEKIKAELGDNAAYAIHSMSKPGYEFIAKA